jgi:hypothetical protein
MRLSLTYEEVKPMLHITGKEHIDIRDVKKMAVSNITPVGEPGNPQAYQRILVIVTNEGILELSIEAKERNTICFAGDWMILPDEKLHLDKDADD